MSSEDKQTAPTEEQATLAEQSQLVFDSVGAVFNDFQQQWSARFKLAGKEWQLTKQSASMVVILCLMLAAILSTVWLLGNLAIGFMLFETGLSVYMLCLSLMGVNIVLVLVLWQTIKTLCLNIGFSRCINSLSSDLPNEEQH